MWQVDLRSVSGDPISRVRTQRAAAADPARRGRNILPICGNTHHYHIAHPPIDTIAYLMNGSQPFQQLTVSRRGTRGGAFMRLRQAAGSRTAENDPKSQASRRTLPLPNRLVVVLKSARKRQAAERLALGGAGGPWAYVVCNEA